MKQQVEYEIQSLSELQEIVNTLKAKIPYPVTIKQAPEGSSLYLSTEQRDLRIQIFPQLKEDLTESYYIEAIIPSEEFEQIFRDVLGPPKKVTRIMPTILDFANVVLKVSRDTWKADVSKELSLNEKELERFTRALADAASMKGAPTPVIEAARRLSLL